MPYPLFVSSDPAQPMSQRVHQPPDARDPLFHLPICALEWVSRARTRYPFQKLVGGRFPLAKINEAFEQAESAAGKGSVARTVVVP